MQPLTLRDCMAAANLELDTAGDDSQCRQRQLFEYGCLL